MVRPIVEIPGVLKIKQPPVHLPEFVLFTSALSCHRSFKCVRVTTFEGKIAEDKFNPSRGDVVPLDLWQRLTRETGAKGALVISKFDQGDAGVFIAFEISTIKSDRLSEAYLRMQKKKG
jgi:hypothetical protein